MQLIPGWRAEGVVRPSETPVFVWRSIGTTALTTGLIGVLGTVLGLPAGWMMRRGSTRRVALAVVPLLMPSYLAYAGWGLLRGPGSWLGDWLAHGSPARSLVFDYVLAVCGLALWAWPIGAFVVGAAARRIPGHLLDALALEPGAAWRRWRVVGGMLAGPMAASATLIALVMAGSAVPLHLAQVDTYAIHLWKYLSLASDRRSIWLASAPLLALAGIAAWVVGRWTGRNRTLVADEGVGMDRHGSRTMGALACLVWGLSVLGPLGLFVWNIKKWSPRGPETANSIGAFVTGLGHSSIVSFWRFNGGAVWSSVRNAIVVGGCVGLLAMATFALRACRARGVGLATARVGVWAMLVSAVLPGVLVGAATVAFWNAPIMPRGAGDSMWPVALAHVARFGFLGALAGWWLAGLETADERGARLMLAGESVRAWATLCLRPQIGAVVGVGLAAAAMSLHEIEATVQLQLPGVPSVAQYVLDKLHYNRDEELCAACVNLMGAGIVLAVGAGTLIGRAGKRS